MLRIAHWTVAHRRSVIVAWITAAVAVFAVSIAVGSKNSNDFTLPGTGSQHAADLLKSRFPAQAGDSDQIVFHARTGRITDAADRAVIGGTLAKIARMPHVTGTVSPYAPGQDSISRDGTIAFATVNFNERADVIPGHAIKAVISTAESARSPSLDVQLGGAAIEAANGPSIGFATIVGIAAAMLILLIAFGSFSAMLLPIATALVGLAAGLGVTSLASHVVSMPDFASQLALMIGLGVGVDYALFIVTRFRENYRRNGGDVQSAVANAMNTSGRAVLFAGATVVIALLGMLALGVNLLSGVGVAGAVVVALVMSASVTLLPALLGVVGHRVGGVVTRRAQQPAVAQGFWLRWVGAIQRRPSITALAATAIMLTLATPVLGLRLGSSDAGNDPTSHTTRQAYDLLAKGFGRGFNGPLEVAVALPRSGDAGAVSRLATALRDTAGIASVAPPHLNPAGTAAAVTAFPTTSPESSQTASLVKRLRSSVIPPFERASHARVYVGGPTASDVDFSHVLSSKLPLFIGVVIGVAALLLVVVFRSLVIPLQAAAMNLLSIGASLGVVQAVFERGWLGSLFGVHKGPIDAFIPVLTFAIVFGLSMDYEVFLISRVHEEWQTRKDASAAIREGLARTGRVITAAAAVMVVVFGAFAISGDRVLAMFGLALATAVFLDALVVRLVLLPATLQLLGRATWTLPSWLERRLPRVAIEPARGSRRPAGMEPAFEEGS